MNSIRLIVDPRFVNSFLSEHGMTQGHSPLYAALLQCEGTANNQAAVMLVVEVNSKLVLTKTTLALLESVVRTMREAEPAIREAYARLDVEAGDKN